MTERISDVLAPAKPGPVTLRNRVLKSATDEGPGRGDEHMPRICHGTGCMLVEQPS
ncbi:hypothetical protein SAMN04489712_120127 [Thermomonospora echinospora]|uniref:Uncharacterized protein n=1 Tax=Thermomonospora echinospora TaxID=1992 RepID=A0A1H6DRS3_9ACTN|nr:hypothetical protein [Thermomonospora echinospora]SEG87413.1 hypothetical protein SAMN04489712_120127 [Thermomonospora echinospora]